LLTDGRVPLSDSSNILPIRPRALRALTEREQLRYWFPST
jgi:hypothetical protein